MKNARGVQCFDGCLESNQCVWRILWGRLNSINKDDLLQWQLFSTRRSLESKT